LNNLVIRYTHILSFLEIIIVYNMYDRIATHDEIEGSQEYINH